MNPNVRLPIYLSIYLSTSKYFVLAAYFSKLVKPFLLYIYYIYIYQKRIELAYHLMVNIIDVRIDVCCIWF